MAEVNELSLSNLEGVTTPSISQETAQQVNNELSLNTLDGVESNVIDLINLNHHQ